MPFPSFMVENTPYFIFLPCTDYDAMDLPTELSVFIQGESRENRENVATGARPDLSTSLAVMGGVAGSFGTGTIMMVVPSPSDKEMAVVPAMSVWKHSMKQEQKRKSPEGPHYGG
jgi:hypothetical protein